MATKLLEGHELLSVVLYVQEQKFEVRIRDNLGRLRHITLNWYSKDLSALPDHWVDSINGEIEYQRTEELNRTTGRFVP